MLVDSYFPVLVFMVMGAALVGGILFLSHVRSKRLPGRDKAMAYECGFPPLEQKLPPLDIRFYVVGLLFLLFDVEVVFLFPWAVTLKTTGALGFFSMAFFLGVLTLGFIYEWVQGALEWT